MSRVDTLIHPLLSCLIAGLAALALLTNSPVVQAASLVVAVQTSDGRPLRGAVLTLHPAGTDRPAAPMNVVMDQLNRTFVPDLLVVPVGSSVVFSNGDSVSHQIYSFSPAKKFQLPLYRGKPYPPVLFDQPGVITLGCNIHDSMLAYVLVTDAPYFGTTDASGTWSTEVPRGTYKLVVWHPRQERGEEIERQVIVGADEHASLSLRLGKPLRPAPLQSHHSWDAY